MKPSDWLEARFQELSTANGIGMSPSRAKWQALKEWLDQDKADQGGKRDQHFAEVGEFQVYAPSAACHCGHRYDEHAMDWQACEKCPCKGFGYYTATRDSNTEHKWPETSSTDHWKSIAKGLEYNLDLKVQLVLQLTGELREAHDSIESLNSSVADMVLQRDELRAELTNVRFDLGEKESRVRGLEHALADLIAAQPKDPGNGNEGPWFDDEPDDKSEEDELEALTNENADLRRINARFRAAIKRMSAAKCARVRAERDARVPEKR